MSNEAMKYKTGIALRNYGIVLGMLIGMTAVLLYLGNPVTVVLLKLAFVPLIFLSFGGLTVIYRWPIVEAKLTARAVEYYLLNALILSLFLFVVLWESERSVPELFGVFALGFVSFAIIKLSMLLYSVKQVEERDRLKQIKT